MLAEKLQEAAGNGLASTLYVDDVFSTWLYTGTGAAQTITNGIDLSGQGGMTWIKSRSAATDHKLTDTVRGATKALISDTTGAQTTDANGLTAFSSTGFSIGTDSVYNTNAATYASWTFRKAAKFFDVQTVSHTSGTANTIDLSTLATVGMVIAKNITTTGNWDVWHRSLTAGNNLQLNLTNAQSTTNAWLSVSGTTATLAASAPTGTYVIYAYAHDTATDGIIQCGTFVSGGGGDAVVNLSMQPQFVLVKSMSAAGGWIMFDTMRGLPVSGSSCSYLQANAATAESTGSQGYLTTTGFGVNLQASTTYIYMAIRRPNKPPTSGTQVYNANTAGTAEANTANVGFYSGFPVDMVIYREDKTNAANDTKLYDRLRGSSLDIRTNTTGAEGVSTFPLDASLGVWNTALTTNINKLAWMFKRAPGFFDVVCYTGTGSATTQAHELTVVPELIIVKERSAANDWWVYNATVGNTKYSVLNSTAIPVTSSTAWNNTTPTSSVFSIGTGANVNASTQTYVAYLFATLAGISKVGSYTGNGTTQTINCGFTGGARFVLIKRTDSTGDWYVFDTTRGMTTLTDPYLLLNSTAAEVATLGAVTSVTTGFAVNAAIVAAINTNAASYIYLSVA